MRPACSSAQRRNCGAPKSMPHGHSSDQPSCDTVTAANSSPCTKGCKAVRAAMIGARSMTVISLSSQATEITKAETGVTPVILPMLIQRLR